MTDDTDIIPKRISPSQIREALRCPRAYLLKYVMSLKPTDANADYFIFGRAFDDVLHGTPVELADLRPLDESKKPYRAWLAGLKEAVGKKLDLKRLACPEVALRTETETIKIDGLYIEENDDWWLVEVKTTAEKGFDLEEARAKLRNDHQLAAYFARMNEIAAALFLDMAKFKGCKYVWGLKPWKRKDPEYVAHVIELTEKDLGDPTTTWRVAKGFGRLVQDTIRTTYLQRRDPLDVPCNPSSCKTLTGVCGFWEVCYGQRAKATADTEEVCT